MNHETLQALYELDVAEAGEEEAAKRWEYWAIGDKMWNTSTPVLMFIGQDHRRKPSIPWPKVVQDTAFKDYVHQRLDAMGVPHSIPESEHDKAGCRVGGRLDWVEEKLQPIPAWPADAPEWANYMTIDRHFYECKYDFNGKTVIERPKPPAVKKIDWTKLASVVSIQWEAFTTKSARQRIPSPWIAWNCDEHTRGNPLPDGLLIEYFIDGYDNKYTTNPPNIYWGAVTRFRIVGVQKGWE